MVKSSSINDYKVGKRVRMKGSPSLFSYNMWLNLVKNYPTLKRPCHLRDDGILEIVAILAKKYVLVKVLDEEKEAFSVFEFHDLELLS